MSFPVSWNLLPGPSRLLHVVVADIVAGYTVVLGLPPDLPKSMFSVDMSERTHGRGLRRLSVFRDHDVQQVRPQHLYLEKLVRLRERDIPMLMDLRSTSIGQDEWFEYLHAIQDFSDWPRGVIVFEGDRVLNIAERKGLRYRVWCDFVSRLDCSVLLARTEEDSGLTPDCYALKDALVGELAGADIGIAQRLIDLPIRDLLDEGTYSSARIWAAQVSVLFPIIDRERRRILHKYSQHWIIPYRASDTRIVGRVIDLEIRDMIDQAERNVIMRSELRLLRWLRRVRNLIAHMKIVNWGTLVSPDASGVVNFRDS